MYDDRGNQLGPEAISGKEQIDQPENIEFNQNCQKVIKFLLLQPKFMYQVHYGRDAKTFSQAIEIDASDWMKVNVELIGKLIISAVKSSKDQPRPDVIQLSLDDLAKAKDEPYVTEEIIQLALDQAAAQKSDQQ